MTPRGDGAVAVDEVTSHGKRVGTDGGTKAALELDHVWRWYGDGDTRVDALHDVNLRVAEGEFLAVTGPSGSGKSTLLQIMGLLDRPSEGVVRLGGRDVGQLSDGERTSLRLRELGFVFQRFHLLPTLTAIENVALPMEAAGVPASERYDRAAALLTSMGLAARLTFLQSQLSGGQRQRVAIARALANNPRLILADEPTGALHSEDQAQVVELLRHLHDDGRTVIVVTHDLDVAAFAQRQVEIRDGRVGPPEHTAVRAVDGADRADGAGGGDQRGPGSPMSHTSTPRSSSDEGRA